MDEGFSKCFILCQGINDCFSDLKWIGHRSNANKVIVRFIKEVRRTRLKFLEEHWITCYPLSESFTFLAHGRHSVNISVWSSSSSAD